MVSITLLCATPPTLDNDVFTNVPKYIPVYVPCGSLAAYQAAAGWSDFTNIVSEGCVQTITLNGGWNWWTPTVEITLADLEAALGTNGLIIKSQDISAVYVASTNTWRNNDLEIEVGKMYKIKTSVACTITLTGIAVDPAEYPITVNTGVNWVGFIGTEVTSLDQAFTEFTPANLDVVKTAHGTAVYYRNKGWRGTVSTLSPGQGYLYKSKASGKRTFTYPSAE